MCVVSCVSLCVCVGACLCEYVCVCVNCCDMQKLFSVPSSTLVPAAVGTDKVLREQAHEMTTANHNFSNKNDFHVYLLIMNCKCVVPTSHELSSCKHILYGVVNIREAVHRQGSTPNSSNLICFKYKKTGGKSVCVGGGGGGGGRVYIAL